ncbi:MAG: GNAT family N-acetyltransferase [Candidatus Aenigmarchaeota archaeon]|nr:GNAT family N-acetyltransferase [Candidatus Aenigmarchaeota archaeon]
MKKAYTRRNGRKEKALIRLKELFYGNEGYCFVMKEQGKTIGFIFARRQQWGNEHAVNVDDMTIARGFQGKGRGAALWKYFENKMKSAGVARIYLLVHVKSRAMKFHRKNGFWKMGDVLMEKILK